MNLLTFGDIKNPPSSLPSRLNLCPSNPRFMDLVNRAIELLLAHGSWWGTTRPVLFCISDSCIVVPSCVANIEGARACGRPMRIEGNGYRFLPTFNPQGWDSCNSWIEYYDQVPCFYQPDGPMILRTFVGSNLDRGKTIRFLGYDKNRNWVRTLENGVMVDGELVTLPASGSFVDTVTAFESITGTIKAFSSEKFNVFGYPEGDDSTMSNISAYEYWETAPSYQRYKVINQHYIASCACETENVIECKVKIEFIPVRFDTDLLVLCNRQAIEMAVEAVRLLEDHDQAGADVLLFGSRDNQRIGAVPLLQQELRTHTGDRVPANVQVHGNASFNRVMCGFI